MAKKEMKMGSKKTFSSNVTGDKRLKDKSFMKESKESHKGDMSMGGKKK